MVHLQRFHEAYEREGLFVYAIAVHEDRSEAIRLTNEMKITYTVFDGTGSTLQKRYAYG